MERLSLRPSVVSVLPLKRWRIQTSLSPLTLHQLSYIIRTNLDLTYLERFCSQCSRDSIANTCCLTHPRCILSMQDLELFSLSNLVNPRLIARAHDPSDTDSDSPVLLLISFRVLLFFPSTLLSIPENHLCTVRQAAIATTVSET